MNRMRSSQSKSPFEKIRTLFIILFIAAFAAACAAPSGGRGPGGPGGPGRGGSPDGAMAKKMAKRGGARPSSPGDFFYSQALALKNDGKCEEAIPVFSKLAEMGYGYEIAQYHLGDCLLTVAGDEEDPSRAAVHEALALHWLLKAGHSNNADAQGLLAALYLDGYVVPEDRVEAAKWYLLYMRNPIQLKVGAMPLPAGLEVYLLDELRPQEWAKATEEADAWQVVKQEINRPSDDGKPRRARGADGDRPRRLTENSEAQIQS